MPRNGVDTESDDRRLLELVADVCGLLDLAELRYGLIDAMRRVLPSDWASLNDIGPGPGEVFAISRPDGEEELYSKFQQYAHENPILQRHLSTLDSRAYRFSDLVTRDELHALPLYREVYARMKIEYQLAFMLPGGPGRVLAIALSRSERDYTDAERDFANRARPYLIQAYLNAIAYQSLRAQVPAGAPDAPLVESLMRAGLTPREAQAMKLLALGKSNHHIATALGISHRTVGKHLERGFRKLSVTDRSSAADRVWQLAAAAEGSPAVRKSADALLGELGWGPRGPRVEPP